MRKFTLNELDLEHQTQQCELKKNILLKLEHKLTLLLLGIICYCFFLIGLFVSRLYLTVNIFSSIDFYFT